MPAEGDPPEKWPPLRLADAVWWTRLHRAAEREGLIGAPGLMADWCHDMLRVLASEEFELTEGRWQPIAAGKLTDEFKRREARRLNDELGKRLGVGPMPGDA